MKGRTSVVNTKKRPIVAFSIIVVMNVTIVP